MGEIVRVCDIGITLRRKSRITHLESVGLKLDFHNYGWAAGPCKLTIAESAAHPPSRQQAGSNPLGRIVGISEMCPFQYCSWITGKPENEVSFRRNPQERGRSRGDLGMGKS